MNVAFKEDLEATHSKGSLCPVVNDSNAFTESWDAAHTETFYEGIPIEDVRRAIQCKNEKFKPPLGKLAEVENSSFIDMVVSY